MCHSARSCAGSGAWPWAGKVWARMARAAGVKRTGRNSLDAFDYDAKGGGKVLVYYFDFDGPSAALGRFSSGARGGIRR